MVKTIIYKNEISKVKIQTTKGKLMKKVLWYSDFNCSTGFATVAQNILQELEKTGEYEFTVIGINHWGEPYNYEKWKFPIYPAIKTSEMDKPNYKDFFGRQRLLDFLGTGEFDILFTLQDTFIVEPIGKAIKQTLEALEKAGKPCKWIFYYPVDGVMKDSWKETAKLADCPVTYTQFAKTVSNFDVEVIPHGTNLTDFYPLPADEIAKFKQEYFKTDKYIVANVNRNQPRKDIPRTLLAFKEFHKQRPDTILYLHMLSDDIGGNILEMAKELDIDMASLMLPDSYYPVEILNKIYNASDVVISTTLGEGWGLTCTEAMATKTPVIMPSNTSLNEICADGRGYLVQSGIERVWLSKDNNQSRPLTDTKSMVEALKFLYDNPDEAQEQTMKAYNWVKELSWEKVCKEWIDVFYCVSNPITDKVGRNEPCPRHPEIKYKKCKCSKEANV